MDTITTFVTDPRLVTTGWTLAVILFETLALGVLFAIWRLLFPRASATAQYAAGVAVLSMAVTLAAVTPAVLPFFPVSRLRAAPSVTANTVAPSVVTTQPDSTSRSTILETSVTPTATFNISPDAVAGVAGLAWITGILLLAFRLLGGAALAAWIRRRATPVASEEILATADRLVSDLGLKQPVTLLESAQVEAPVVIGWRHPALVLPSGVLTHIAPEALVPLLAHEFAHIRRRDYLANLLQSIVELPLFFSPAALWISRRIREAREYCCDDAAVNRCKDPRPYIDALMTLASLATVNPIRPVLGAAGPRLVVRVRRIMQGESLPKLRQMQLVGLATALAILVSSGWRVAAISSERSGVRVRERVVERQTTAEPVAVQSAPTDVAPAAAPAQPPAVTQTRSTAPAPPTPAARAPIAFNPPSIPFGVGVPDDAGVKLDLLRWTPEEPLQAAAITNVTIEPVSAVRLVAIVERFPKPQALQIVTSNLVQVQIAPGQRAEVTNVPFPAELRDALMSGERMQVFFSVQEVQFANGYQWITKPNSAALSHREALGFPKAYLTRELMQRQAAGPPESVQYCVHENGSKSSLGLVIAIFNEPGRRARCVAGRWEDYTGR